MSLRMNRTRKIIHNEGAPSIIRQRCERSFGISHVTTEDWEGTEKRKRGEGPQINTQILEMM